MKRHFRQTIDVPHPSRSLYSTVQQEVELCAEALKRTSKSGESVA